GRRAQPAQERLLRPDARTPYARAVLHPLRPQRRLHPLPARGPDPGRGEPRPAMDGPPPRPGGPGFRLGPQRREQPRVVLALVTPPDPRGSTNPAGPSRIADA